MTACDSQKEEVIKIQEKTQKTTNGPEVCDQSCLLCISVILIRLRVFKFKIHANYSSTAGKHTTVDL